MPGLTGTDLVGVANRDQTSCYLPLVRGHSYCRTHSQEGEDMVTVQIENEYSDGHTSTLEIQLPEPPITDLLTDDAVSEWFDDAVYPHTGDGHGDANQELGTYYKATIVSAETIALVGLASEWID